MPVPEAQLQLQEGGDESVVVRVGDQPGPGERDDHGLAGAGPDGAAVDVPDEVGLGQGAEGGAVGGHQVAGGVGGGQAGHQRTDRQGWNIETSGREISPGLKLLVQFLKTDKMF